MMRARRATVLAVKYHETPNLTWFVAQPTTLRDPPTGMRATVSDLLQVKYKQKILQLRNLCNSKPTTVRIRGRMQLRQGGRVTLHRSAKCY